MKSGAFPEFLQFLNSLSTAEDSLGSFSIDDGDGSENVFFRLCRVYSNSLKMSHVGKLPWS